MVTQTDQLIKVATSMEMEALGQKYAAVCRSGARIYLRGELGAGKTTWVRGFLRGWQYLGTVKSPTYTLVETYHVQGQTIHHLDLYRINDPVELESIGIREYLDGEGICLVEWPERGGELVAVPDIMVKIAMHGSERIVRMQSYSSTGTRLLAALE